MPSIELRTRQSFALTPRLQQSVRLLQLSSQEFQQELRTALDTNPFLEYDPSETDDVALAAVTPGDFSGACGSGGSTRQNGDSPSSDPAEWARSQPTLREQLHDALRLSRLGDRDRAAARFIIEALDDDGYLRQDLSDLADSVDLEPGLAEAELLVARRTAAKYRHLMKVPPAELRRQV